MTVSLYQATVPTYLQQLRALRGLLDKAAAFCAEGGATEADIQQARLADDMAPFASQVRWGTAHSIKAIEACRAGTFGFDPTPAPATFAEQQVVLAETIAALEALTAEDVNALAESPVLFSIPRAGVELPFIAADFLLSFSLPNFYFHVTTAYNLLRSRGVQIGKSDFLGQLRIKEH